MKLTHSIIKKHRGPSGSKLLLATFEDVTTINGLCNQIEKYRDAYTNYDTDPEKSRNLWAGDVLELVMEAWFQYSNGIDAYNTGKPGMIAQPIGIKNYAIIDRDAGNGEEDHGVDAMAETSVEGGITIQIKYRKSRDNLSRNDLATYMWESQNPRYNAPTGRRLVITTADGSGGGGRGLREDIKKYWGFDNIYYVNRFLLSRHMDGTTFWAELYAALKEHVGAG